MQSTDLTTFSGTNTPKRSLNFWQGGAIVDKPNEAGNPSCSLVDVSSQVLKSAISKCKTKSCKSSPKLETKLFFYSNVTDTKYFIINSSIKTIKCHTSNILCPLTCEDCGTLSRAH